MQQEHTTSPPLPLFPFPYVLHNSTGFVRELNWLLKNRRKWILRFDDAVTSFIQCLHDGPERCGGVGSWKFWERYIPIINLGGVLRRQLLLRMKIRKGNPTKKSCINSISKDSLCFSQFPFKITIDLYIGVLDSWFGCFFFYRRIFQFVTSHCISMIEFPIETPIVVIVSVCTFHGYFPGVKANNSNCHGYFLNLRSLALSRWSSNEQI